ncbi:MAG: hypothetical protein AABY95_09775 [Pseudomonadota bacterium]
MSIPPAEFQKRLDSISEHESVPYGRAHLIFDAEAEHGQAILQYRGYLSLSDAFKCFFLETVELLNVSCRPQVKTPLSEFYGLFMQGVAHSFQSLCSAERIAVNGYPLHGYTILRNTFDSLVLSSACLQKIVDFYSVEGVTPGKPLDLAAAKKLRKSTEFQARQAMTGAASGLQQATIDELKKLDELFDLETHGARLSLTDSQEWLRGKAPLPVLATFRERSFAMFMNRFSEVAWMAHRLLPAVQPPGIVIPEPWPEKWRIIDESFQIMVNSLTEQLGKPVGAAIVEFVSKKFPFSEKSTFPL